MGEDWKGASIVLVMGLSLIWQAGFMRECLHLLIWRYRRTDSYPIIEYSLENSTEKMHEHGY